jgi:hypothetical protein
LWSLVDHQKYAVHKSQETVPFGNGFVESRDRVRIGFEMCEEMWTAQSPSNELALQGVEIICNSSGSHHVLGKSCRRISQLVLGTTSKVWGHSLVGWMSGRISLGIKIVNCQEFFRFPELSSNLGYDL